MNHQYFVKIGWLAFLLISLLFPVQTRAQDLSGLTDILNNILKLLTVIKDEDTTPIKNSEITPRTNNNETIDTTSVNTINTRKITDTTTTSEIIDTSTVQQLTDSVRTLIPNIENNSNERSRKIAELHKHIQDSDGSLKALQLQLQIQSQTAMTINTSNQINTLQFKEHVIAQAIQNRLKNRNREMYITQPPTTQDVDINFRTLQFRLGHSNQ